MKVPGEHGKLLIGYLVMFGVFITAIAVTALSCSGTIHREARLLEAARHLEEGKAAWGRGDIQVAWQGFQSAVEADPSNPEVRGYRAYFLTTVAEATADPKVQKAARDVAHADYQFIIQADPEGKFAALARDALAVLEDRILFPEREFPCSEAARKQQAQAHQLFMAGRYRAATPHYQKAIELCPHNAHIWVEYGHALFLVGDFDRSKTLLLEGLKKDEWNRAGHRFLADLEAALGNLEMAYQIAILAVVSDPVYESGWSLLRDITNGMRGQWNRVVNQRPSVSLARDGNPQVILPFDTKKTPAGDVVFWLGLGLTEASELKEARTRPVPTQEEVGRSPLDKERQRVEKNLAYCRFVIAKDPSKDSKIFRIIEDAQKAGFLTEAIFIHLMDKRIADEYIQFRKKHRDRLVEYIKTMVAPTGPMRKVPS
ncbi:MAG: tetratricopeptide repeat protein [Deltaproteobacteria bacterium]|nr:tetratricopeptide repeat protein [Deltaproteobacteria bacterium]